MQVDLQITVSSAARLEEGGDRGQRRRARPLGDLPDGRCRRPAKGVRRDPGLHLSFATTGSRRGAVGISQLTSQRRSRPDRPGGFHAPGAGNGGVFDPPSCPRALGAGRGGPVRPRESHKRVCEARTPQAGARYNARTQANRESVPGHLRNVGSDHDEGVGNLVLAPG